MPDQQKISSSLIHNFGVDTSTQAAGSMRIHTYGLSTGNADDFEVITMAVFGDLA